MSVSRLTGVQLVFSFAPEFQWCCLTTKGSPNEQIYAFTTMKAEGEGWDPVKLALAPSPPPNPTRAIRYFHCGTFC